MATTEQKIKLNLRPSIGVSDKMQQQPTKLLINHGKPNFTINRTTNTKKYLNGVKSEQDENGFTKIILKKASDNNNSSSKLINNGNMSGSGGGIQIKLQSKKSTSNNPEVNNEFLQKRKQIYEKIEKENSLDENGYMNKVENLSNTMSTTTPIEQQSYVKNISRQLENGAVLSQTTTTTTTAAAAVTGVHTSSSSSSPPPAIPPAPPMPNHNKSPIHQNGNGITVIEKQITYKNKDTTDHHTSANKISINSSPANGNANFEQKTFVSFSKDLASEPNKYPDTIKIVKTVSPTSTATATATAASTILNGIENNVDPVVLARRNEVLQELTKLKFDIEVKDDVIIRPVIRDS